MSPPYGYAQSVVAVLRSVASSGAKSAAETVCVVRVHAEHPLGPPLTLPHVSHRTGQRSSSSASRSQRFGFPRGSSSRRCTHSARAAQAARRRGPEPPAAAARAAPRVRAPPRARKPPPSSSSSPRRPVEVRASTLPTLPEPPPLEPPGSLLNSTRCHAPGAWASLCCSKATPHASAASTRRLSASSPTLQNFGLPFTPAGRAPRAGGAGGSRSGGAASSARSGGRGT